MNSEVKQVFGTAENSHHYIMTALIVMLILNGIGDLGTAGDGLLWSDRYFGWQATDVKVPY